MRDGRRDSFPRGKMFFRNVSARLLPDCLRKTGTLQARRRLRKAGAPKRWMLMRQTRLVRSLSDRMNDGGESKGTVRVCIGERSGRQGKGSCRARRARQSGELPRRAWRGTLIERRGTVRSAGIMQVAVRERRSCAVRFFVAESGRRQCPERVFRRRALSGTEEVAAATQKKLANPE